MIHRISEYSYAHMTSLCIGVCIKCGAESICTKVDPFQVTKEVCETCSALAVIGIEWAVKEGYVTVKDYD